MATRETARAKYIAAVQDPLAAKKMCDKLSIYLGGPITEAAPPVANWISFSKRAAEYFDKQYASMQKAYGIFRPRE